MNIISTVQIKKFRPSKLATGVQTCGGQDIFNMYYAKYKHLRSIRSSYRESLLAE